MKQQLPLAFQSSPAYGDADLVETAGNATALAWLGKWPHWPASALVLYGPAGAGKTHLAHIWARRSHAEFITPEFIRDIAAYESIPSALVLEDADKASASNQLLYAQDQLFHLLNCVAAQKSTLLITAQKAPVLWPVQLPDLRSRLLALPTAHIEVPDDAALQAVLLKAFADRQLRVGPEVLSYLARRIERSYTAVHALAATLDAAALKSGRAMTLPFVREVMAELTPDAPHASHASDS